MCAIRSKWTGCILFIHSEEIRELFRNNYEYQQFEEEPSVTRHVWNLISVAVAIDPRIWMTNRN